MSALEPFDRELLDFFCACAHHRVRVVRVKAPRIASLRRLRFAGLVGFDDHLPSASALQGWTERQQTKSEAVTARPANDEPPAPTVAAEGGGAARCDAPPPIDLDRLLQCFSDQFETLRVVAMRFGARSPQKIVRYARMLHQRGLVEQSPPTNGRPFLLWRRAQQNTRGTSGAHGGVRERAPEGGLSNGPGSERKSRTPDTAASTVSSRQREETPRSVGCDEGTSGGKKPIPDEAGPTQVEPAPIVAPLARARPAAPKVDIKVNKRRDPTQRPDTPEMDSAERERIKAARTAQSYKRRVRTRAQNLIDAGKQGGAKGRNYEVRGAMKELQENADAQARFLDPVEQAKTVIRQGGWNCFAATVRDGPVNHYYIGTRVVPEAELLAFAERLRTDRARRAG